MRMFLYSDLMESGRRPGLELIAPLGHWDSGRPRNKRKFLQRKLTRKERKLLKEPGIKEEYQYQSEGVLY